MSYTLPVKIDKGSGTPLVLLHGLGNNHKSWEFVLEHLDYTKWRVIVVDLLGFGDAPKPEVSYSPSDHSDAVLHTLQKLSVTKAVVVGHSMGCIVAIDLAYHHPEYVKKIVLLGAPIYSKRPKTSWQQQLLRTEGLYFSLLNIVKKNPDAVQASGIIANELVPFIRGMEITPEIWPAYKKSLNNTIMQFATYKHASKLHVPTLFVNGWLDFFIIRSNIHAIKKANRTFVRTKNVLGPHELTPRQGRHIAQLLSREARKNAP